MDCLLQFIIIDVAFSILVAASMSFLMIYVHVLYYSLLHRKEIETWSSIFFIILLI